MSVPIIRSGSSTPSSMGSIWSRRVSGGSSRRRRADPGTLRANFVCSFGFRRVGHEPLRTWPDQSTREQESRSIRRVARARERSPAATVSGAPGSVGGGAEAPESGLARKRRAPYRRDCPTCRGSWKHTNMSSRVVQNVEGDFKSFLMSETGLGVVVTMPRGFAPSRIPNSMLDHPSSARLALASSSHQKKLPDAPRVDSGSVDAHNERAAAVEPSADEAKSGRSDAYGHEQDVNFGAARLKIDNSRSSSNLRPRPQKNPRARGVLDRGADWRASAGGHELSAPDRQTRDYGASATRFHTRQCAGRSGQNHVTLAPASLPIGPRHHGRGSAPRRQLVRAGGHPGGSLSHRTRLTLTSRTADRLDSISANKEISTLCDRLFCLSSEREVLICHCAVIRPIATWRRRELPRIVFVENSENRPWSNALPDQFHQNKLHLGLSCRQSLHWPAAETTALHQVEAGHDGFPKHLCFCFARTYISGTARQSPTTA